MGVVGKNDAVHKSEQNLSKQGQRHIHHNWVKPVSTLKNWVDQFEELLSIYSHGYGSKCLTQILDVALVPNQQRSVGPLVD